MKKGLINILLFVSVLCSGQVTRAYSFQVTPSSSSSIDISNLNHWWSFDESSGDLIDLHGTDDGTVTGADYSATGKVGDAYDFESGDAGDYVTLGTGFNYGSGDFSVTMWLNPESLVTTYFIGGPSTAFIMLMNTSGELASGRNGSITSYTTGTVSTGVWTFVALTYDQTVNEMTFYINSNSEVMNYYSSPAAATNSIGSLTNSDYSYDGLIDELNVWGEVLSTSDIAWLYNSGSGRAYSDL